MKEKLEKAFQQLTVNEQASSELIKLREQIKDLQEKIMANERRKFKKGGEETICNLQPINSEVTKMENIAQILHK